MHLSALSAIFKEQPVEEHFLKKGKMLDIGSTILAEQLVTKKLRKTYRLKLYDQCNI